MGLISFIKVIWFDDNDPFSNFQIISNLIEIFGNLRPFFESHVILNSWCQLSSVLSSLCDLNMTMLLVALESL